MHTAIEVTAAIAAVTLAGCIDGFRGANVQIDLSPGNPIQAGFGDTPNNVSILRPTTHFRLYAIQEGETQRLFEIVRFEVHRIVDIRSPCFIDVGEHVPYPGIHVSAFEARVDADTGITDPANPPATASERDQELAATARVRSQTIALLGGDTGLRAVTSASTTPYPPVASDCNGPSNQIPPPSCSDNESNQRRLALCQATWRADPNLWEGTDRVLTAPLNGVTRGMVLNPMTPITGAPVGGAQFFVDNALDNIDAYGIYVQEDGMDTPGALLYFGRPTMPTRGVSHVHLVNPQNSALTAEMAVFSDLGEDDVHF